MFIWCVGSSRSLCSYQKKHPGLGCGSVVSACLACVALGLILITAYKQINKINVHQQLKKKNPKCQNIQWFSCLISKRKSKDLGGQLFLGVPGRLVPGRSQSPPPGWVIAVDPGICGFYVQRLSQPQTENILKNWVALNMDTLSFLITVSGTTQ